ncbi:MAG: hypothetical protein JWQ04_1226 [Pedosphaera sp.]|nr:hypothetical protein [Pedosphaera sp.]
MPIIAQPAGTPPAERLAKFFAAKFLQNGNYEALGTAFGNPDPSIYAQTAALGELDRHFEEEGFSGLAVHSVGYTAGGQNEKVIIYVARGSKKALDAIAKRVDDVEVEAKVMGKLKAGPAPAMSTHGIGHLFERNNRIACGSSCAPSDQSYSGTLGAFLQDGPNMLALSNNHVFGACNHTAVGMPILAPSTMDARSGRRAPTEICRHERIVELRSGDPALVPLMQLDASVGAVTNQTIISSWQGDAINGYDTPAATVAPASGLKVKKFGRTTGLTTGTIEALVPTPWILPYKSGKFSSTVWFENTWTVRSEGVDPFALPGDSGSLVVTEDGGSAIGLLFAVNNKGQYGIIMPILQVLEAFGNVTLVSGHGI